MKYRKYIDKIKKSSSPKPLGQFQPNLAQSILGFMSEGRSVMRYQSSEACQVLAQQTVGAYDLF